ncbi:hypothetical protein, partial [Methanocalculus sp.]|uniref:hypothetical protein n=1 Tax=Methanocalculus sp. TaxID=2004547 RepID=UPI0026185D88
MVPIPSRSSLLASWPVPEIYVNSLYSKGPRTGGCSHHGGRGPCQPGGGQTSPARSERKPKTAINTMATAPIAINI